MWEYSLINFGHFLKVLTLSNKSKKTWYANYTISQLEPLEKQLYIMLRWLKVEGSVDLIMESQKIWNVIGNNIHLKWIFTKQQLLLHFI